MTVQASSVEIRGVSKFFRDFQALKEVSLTIPPGKVTCLIGPSGSGKSHAAALHQLPRGYDLRRDTHRRGTGRLRRAGPQGPRPPAARHAALIGMVFQQFNLWPHMTAQENVAEGLIRVRGLPKADARGRAAQATGKGRSVDKPNSHPVASFGRPAAARRDRPGDRHGAEADAVRRADLGARPGTGGRSASSHEDAGQ